MESTAVGSCRFVIHQVAVAELFCCGAKKRERRSTKPRNRGQLASQPTERRADLRTLRLQGTRDGANRGESMVASDQFAQVEYHGASWYHDGAVRMFERASFHAPFGCRSAASTSVTIASPTFGSNWCHARVNTSESENDDLRDWRAPKMLSDRIESQ